MAEPIESNWDREERHRQAQINRVREASAKVPEQATDQRYIDRDRYGESGGLGRLRDGAAVNAVDVHRPSIREVVRRIGFEAEGFNRRGALAAQAQALMDQHPEVAALLDVLMELRVLRF